MRSAYLWWILRPFIHLLFSIEVLHQSAAAEFLQEWYPLVLLPDPIWALDDGETAPNRKARGPIDTPEGPPSHAGSETKHGRGPRWRLTVPQTV